MSTRLDQATVDLLGVLAYGELTAFERLADDGSFAPTVADKAALAAMAVAEYNHFALLRDRLAEFLSRAAQSDRHPQRPDVGHGANRGAVPPLRRAFGPCV